MGGFLYLASPYSKHPGGREAAFRAAVRAKGLLMSCGLVVFSPIVHSHPVAELCRIDPYDHAIWMADCEPFMRAARGMIVLREVSWEISYGIAEEIKLFQAMEKPIHYMDPGVFTRDLGVLTTPVSSR